MADIAEAINETLNATLNSTSAEADPTTFEGHVIAYVGLFVMALLPIWFGSRQSVAKPKDREEVIKSDDAAMFPVYASGALFGLYLLFRFFGKEYINLLLSSYFMLLGVASLTGSLRPLGLLLCPKSLTEEPYNLSFSQQLKKGKEEATKEGDKSESKKDNDGDEDSKPATPGVYLDFSFDQVDIVCAIVAIAVGVWYVLTKHWIANNLFGLSFSLTGVSMVPLGDYKTGCILLGGLFFYDIFWVFGTDVMVTVAKSFDAPIKVLFPKDLLEHGVFATQHAMLGLGDIVLPGIFIAFMLRFDQSLKAGSKVYFLTTFIAYIVGLITTIVVMHTFKAAQPALLYLSPACTIAPLLMSFARGQFKELLAYNDETPAEKTKKSE